MSHRNKLPPKSRYDESVPAGTPIEQWIWLLNEWYQPSVAFHRTLKRMRKELDAVRTKRLALEGQGTPSEETQKELIVEHTLVSHERGSLQFRSLEVGEAAQDLLKEQGRLLLALGHADHRKFTRRERRIERAVLDIEELNEKFYDELEAEKAKLQALCPIYDDFETTALFIAFDRYAVLCETKEGEEPVFKPIAEYGTIRTTRIASITDILDEQD